MPSDGIHVSALLCRPGLLLLALVGVVGAALLLLEPSCAVCCAVCNCTGVLRLLGALWGTALQHKDVQEGLVKTGWWCGA
jgi:hypothetical protein